MPVSNHLIYLFCFKSVLFQKRINEGELQGSKKFKELVENATKVWEDSLKEEDNEDIREVVKEVEESCDAAIGGIISAQSVDESKDWLEVTPEGLNKMMEAQFSEFLKMQLVRTFLRRFPSS